MHRVFSLRLILSALMGFFMLVSISISFYVSRHLVFNEIVEQETVNMRDRLNFLQGALEYFIRFNEIENIRQLVSSLSSESDLVYFAVVSKDAKVIAVNNNIDLGKYWIEASMSPRVDMVTLVTTSRSTETHHDVDEQTINGYTSLCSSVESASLRPNDCGFVYYKVNLKYHYDKSESSIYRGFLFLALILGVCILMLLFLMSQLITRRVGKLVKVLQLYSDGDYKIRSQLSGQDELSWLSRSINMLLNKIDKDQAEILDREQRLETLFQTVIDAIVIIDDMGIIRRVNKAAEKLFGYAEHELVGSNIAMLMPEPYKSEHDGYIKNYKDSGIKKVIGVKREVEGVKKDGSVFPIDISVTEMMVGTKKMYSGIVRDITERKDFERIMKNINDELLSSNRKLNEYAIKDSLTNIFNRRAFDTRIDEELNRATRDKLPLSLLMCDIDYFKLYNDTYGHQAGDDCLYKVAMVIKTFFQRGGEMVARYGGEEFAVILPNTDKDRAKWLSELLLKAIHELGVVHATSKVSEHVTVSIGVGTYNPSGNIPTSPHHLIGAADEGLYKAKSNGRDRVEIGATID